MHRDLKPENILLNSKEKADIPEVKIIDFGTAKIWEPNEGGIQEYVGTPLYMAPEVIQAARSKRSDEGDQHKQTYDH